MKKTILLLLIMVLVFVSCCVARKGKHVSVTQDKLSFVQVDTIYDIAITDLKPIPKVSKKNHIIIKKDYDLGGKNLCIEEGYILSFQGGSFKNGYITGNNTGITYKGRAVFDRIGIRGTWRVESISTDMFKDLNYEQSLADVLALTNAHINNNVVIKDYGYNYPVRVTSIGMYHAPLKLYSNTDLQLDGHISLMPTNLYQYNIVIVDECNNVKIHGKGSINGDKNNHDYSIDEQHIAWKSHEWGRGIRVSRSKDILISGIFVNDCTGDSYNIAENSRCIILDGVTAAGSRRQGITIAVASDVTIKDCHFINIGRDKGTAPGAAIDIEPNNEECEINNIIIDGCIINNCRQGVISWSHGYGNTWKDKVDGKTVLHRDGRHYVNLTITNCSIDETDCAFSLYGWDKATVRGCNVTNADYFTIYPKNTTFTSNNIECEHFMNNWAKISNCSIIDNSIKVKNKSVIRLDDSAFDDNSFIDGSSLDVRN